MRRDNEQVLLLQHDVRATKQPYKTALLASPTKQPYQQPYSAALPCLALQGALSPLPGPGVSHSARENLANSDPFPAITEYKRGETSPHEQKRDHPVDGREWPSQKSPEKI